MKVILLLVLFLPSLFTSCSKISSGYKHGPADMQYLIHHDEPGNVIKEGDFLSMHYIHRTEEGSLLASSYNFDQPTFMEQIKPVFKGDIFDGLALLSEGDSATFKLNFDSMQTALNVMKPPTTKSNYLYFTVKIEKVIARGKLNDSSFRQKVEGLISVNANIQKKKEPLKIRQYLSTNNLKPVSTSSGLNYIITKIGHGPPLRLGEQVNFEYTGRLLATGKVFITNNADTAARYGYNLDETQKYIPGKVVAGSGTIMPGIDEALVLLPKGTEAMLIIPSKLAYGENGQNMGLPPFAPLIFEIEIM